jgi:hypothetical protein
MTPYEMNAATPQRRPATEEISGLIERVTFHNEENGFCVLRVKTPGRRDETTVIGSLPSVTAGEWGSDYPRPKDSVASERAVMIYLSPAKPPIR